MISFLHLLPGRLRLKFDALKRQPKLATRLHAHLSAVSGIDRVDVNPRTGSVLLYYNPSALASPAFLDAFSALRSASSKGGPNWRGALWSSCRRSGVSTGSRSTRPRATVCWFTTHGR